MTPLEFLLLLLVAGICGAIGQSIAGSTRGGILTSIALGFIGALIGMAMARALQLPEPFNVVIEGHPFPVIWSIVGAAVFVAVITLLTRSPREVV
jgi:uncharacterized membrane protein YeaQ/YmgE (transglycosylase-associated protein family)